MPCCSCSSTCFNSTVVLRIQFSQTAALRMSDSNAFNFSCQNSAFLSCLCNLRCHLLLRFSFNLPVNFSFFVTVFHCHHFAKLLCQYCVCLHKIYILPQFGDSCFCFQISSLAFSACSTNWLIVVNVITAPQKW